MCGIAGIASLSSTPIPALQESLSVMNDLQRHRGPDGAGIFVNQSNTCGLAHRRLSIIDLSTGNQPMSHSSGLNIVFNGEIYNYIELREEIGVENFQTTSDTEVILLSYLKWGKHCLSRLRGMFTFAIWDDRTHKLFLARDRVGIKPLYYHLSNGRFFFASEVKTLLPFVKEISFDRDALKDYLTFQLYLNGKTLFKDISELPPGYLMEVAGGNIATQKYWEVFYQTDLIHSPSYFQDKLSTLFEDSIKLHCRADVPISAYVSGGTDSSLVSILASRFTSSPMKLFVGKFSLSKEYDESEYAQAVSNHISGELIERDISCDDFIKNIENVIYHLDFPVAGPGSFSQYMISEMVARHRKVVLGGQGGDEIFGGYVRYLIAYFEQCIRGAIDGTLRDGQFVVTYESIIPNLGVLRDYKPLIKEFWKEGLFGPMDERYFRLVNRAPTLDKEIHWDVLGDYSPFESFQKLFNVPNVGRKAYFDKMTHFDFQTLLPALLQIEDRVSMAHGLESRVPFIDHEIIEFAATAPANVKFGEGKLKRLLVDALGHHLPKVIRERTDKKGFPTPITTWAKGQANEFIRDIFSTNRSKQREFFNHVEIERSLFKDSEYGRKLWGLLSLELWCSRFLDRAREFSSLNPMEKV